MQRSPRLRHPSLAQTVLGGLGASGAIFAANRLAENLGITDLDLPRVLGLSFRDPGQPGLKAAGAAWYFATGGVLVPLAYWLGFRALGAVGVRRGLAFGVVHFVMSGLLLAATDPDHPKRRRGRGRPMGPWLSRYGALERVVNGGGHLAYGAALGIAAARR